MANEASTMLTVDLTDLGAAILEELRTKIEKDLKIFLSSTNGDQFQNMSSFIII